MNQQLNVTINFSNFVFWFLIFQESKNKKQTTIMKRLLKYISFVPKYWQVVTFDFSHSPKH